MGLQLERKCAGANHVQVLGPVCGAEEVPHSQGGAVSVPQHVPVGELAPSFNIQSSVHIWMYRFKPAFKCRALIYLEFILFNDLCIGLCALGVPSVTFRCLLQMRETAHQTEAETLQVFVCGDMLLQCGRFPSHGALRFFLVFLSLF